MCPKLAKNTPSQNHSENSTFRSAKGSDSCYIGYQPLYYDLALSKVIRGQEGVPTSTRAQEGVLTSQSGSLTTKCCLNWPTKRPAKITPKIALSALPRDPTAVTLVINHSFFIKRPQVKVSELKNGFLHHKVAPRP